MSSIPNIFLSFFAGLISFLSPCVLPLIPSYLAFLSGASWEELHKGRNGTVVWRAIWFVVGFSLLFTILGVLFSSSAILISGRIISLVAGIIIILLGLNVIFDFFSLLNVEKRFHVRKNPTNNFSALLIGMAFGAGWSPCIGPILTSILFLAGQSEGIVSGTGLLIVYSLGLGLPFIVAGVFFPTFIRFFNVIRRHFRAIRIASGILLLIVGLFIMTNQLRQFNSWLVRISFAITQAGDTRGGQYIGAAVLFLLGILALIPVVVWRVRHARVVTSRRSAELSGTHAREGTDLPPADSKKRSYIGYIVCAVIGISLLILSILQLVGAIQILHLFARWIRFQGV